ncbi:MAG: RecQ family ATP-dependent DNA helicase [Cyclobacteriaceae bacterium]
MTDPQEILVKYWGYKTFRALQPEIIDAVINGKDTLALMPTGGGKSICFQIPALAKPGISIVITPLIALMKDQVERLRLQGIKAEAIYSGMSRREIDIKLDNCVYGDIKFLYISPERLKTELFIERAKKMKVNLLVVDEAHCISEWGYDFRPAYLEIANFRKLLPKTNLIAVTATATPEVKQDIIAQLQLQDPAVFQKSFAREQLGYSVVKVEDKMKRLLEILQRVPGSGLIYLRSRKRTEEIALWLRKHGIQAAHYHAGMSAKNRALVQEKWISDQLRVMVATNAFGMGIDKPDVRVVIHLDLPDHLEAYYQEAGRAGRDDKQAFAIILYHPNDLGLLKQRKEWEYPSLDYLKQVYQSLANYYKIAVGSYRYSGYDFDLDHFAQTYQYKPLSVYHALKKLEQEGLVQLNDSFYQPSQLMVNLEGPELYEFQIAQATYDPLIKTLLRLHGGELLSSFVSIDESKMARLMKWSLSQVKKKLQALADLKVVTYQPQKDRPQIAFLSPRQQADNLQIDANGYQRRRDRDFDKIKAMESYVTNETRCRSQLLLEYFAEISYQNCGICDYCRKKIKAKPLGESDKQEILQRLVQTPLTIEGLVKQLQPENEKALLQLIRQMLDQGELSYDTLGRIQLSRQNV